MNIIVTADANWGIGYNGKPLVNIPADFRFFREVTEGKVVVMGRKTMERLPGRKPVPGRVNLVLSNARKWQVKDAEQIRSLEELKERLRDFASEDIFIMGGEDLFREMLPLCDTVHVTRMDETYPADAWFPNLDEMKEWQITGDSEEQTYFDIEYRFFRYERRNGNKF